MRGVVSIGDVVDLRRKLSERGLGWTVHLHDACGAQTLSLEALEGAAPLAQAQGAVREFFSAKSSAVEFDEAGGTTFWLA